MAELGARSPLVLAKLGHDLRPVFEETLRAPLPTPIQKLADQLDGYADWQDVGAPPEPEPAPDVHLNRLWDEAVAADTPFRFSDNGSRIPLGQESDAEWPPSEL